MMRQIPTSFSFLMTVTLVVTTIMMRIPPAMSLLSPEQLQSFFGVNLDDDDGDIIMMNASSSSVMHDVDDGNTTTLSIIVDEENSSSSSSSSSSIIGHNKECQTITDLVCSNNSGDLDIFCNLLVATGYDDVFNDDITDMTVFAPNDDAFTYLSQEFAQTLVSSVENMEWLILYHTVRYYDNNNDGAAVLSSDKLECGKLVLMANERNTRTICSSSTSNNEDNSAARKIYQRGGGNADDSDNNNSLSPEIIEFDIKACNGNVVHIVNKVIVPKKLPDYYRSSDSNDDNENNNNYDNNKIEPPLKETVYDDHLPRNNDDDDKDNKENNNANSSSSSLPVSSASASEMKNKNINFIIIQPDDHYFFQEWDPPSTLFEKYRQQPKYPYENFLPNIENRIRNAPVSLDMKNSYASSTMCGTSRYSTITGRYPSRSSYGRMLDRYSSLRNVKIPYTKLEDVRGVDDAKDCSDNNIAALLQQNGYRTGVFGKWHLSADDGGSYDRIQRDVKDCGFDTAEAIYKENMVGRWYGDATHNMEHVTAETLEFIRDNQDEPFFLYFNPTVPHDTQDVTDALRYGDCRDRIDGRRRTPRVIFGEMSKYNNGSDDDDDCSKYRRSVLDRADSNDDKMAGAVWIDDSVGSIMDALEAYDILDQTFILFQLDHGVSAKGSLFEGGSKIAQFVRFPTVPVPIPNGSSSSLIQLSSSTFYGLVSTIDVAPTISDLAGIPESKRYNMDGKSWMVRLLDTTTANANDHNDRCLFVEEDEDRSVRCGCYKYVSIENTRSDSITVYTARTINVDLDRDNYYYLCDEETDRYISSIERSPERSHASKNIFTDSIRDQLKEKIKCHKKMTDPSKKPNYKVDCGLPLKHSSSKSSSDDS